MMWKRICLSLTGALVAMAAQAQSRQDTVFVADFGAKAYSYENSVTQIQSAIRACKERQAKVLVFPEGRFDLWPEGATRREYFISNTSTEWECPSKVKTVGLMFEDMHGLEVKGSNTLLMFHGEMLTIAVERCSDITFTGLGVDFQRPTASEMTFEAAGKGFAILKVHRDTQYEIVNGRINLFGEGWKTGPNQCIEYDPELETFRYTNAWYVLPDSPAEELEPGRILFHTPEDYRPKVGNVLTIRDIIRDQVGMFVLRSKNVTLHDMQMHYMHGLGIVSQFSENITMRRVKCCPRPETGRLLAASADMMHFSGCKGHILVDSCYFAGAHDDPINIHGTNLRVVERIDARTANLRFTHGQSYGFQAYYPGDTVAFIKASTMQRLAPACVKSVKQLSERVWQVAFDRDIPEWVKPDEDCVENMTCTPSVEIRNNFFARTDTRGTLVTTPRKVVIENNVYHKTGMSAVLIESDTKEWFESGPVCDVTIKGNTFIDCAYNGGPNNAVIAINPSNADIDPDRPVHRNVRIEDNVFKVYDYPVLYAKSTQGISFINNVIERTHTLAPFSGNRNTFYLNGCKDVVIRDVTFRGDVLGRNIRLEHMPRKYLKAPKDLKVDWVEYKKQ